VISCHSRDIGIECLLLCNHYKDDGRGHVREYVPCSGQEYGHVVVLQTYVLHIGCAYGPTVTCGGPDPRVGMKGKRLLQNDHWMFQACELGLPLQGYETRFRIVRFSRRLRLLIPSAT
jgi:hypothetical protein